MKNIGIIFVVAVAVLTTFVLLRPQVAQVKTEPTGNTIATQPHQKAKQEAQGAFRVLMAAIEANDYTRFITPLEDEMKAALNKQSFEVVVAQFAPRLKTGYRAVYFGEMKKKGYTVHLWKLTFKDQSDDVLAELSIKNRKVGGFFLR
jgi:hypothetical protein